MVTSFRGAMTIAEPDLGSDRANVPLGSVDGERDYYGDGEAQDLFVILAGALDGFARLGLIAAGGSSVFSAPGEYGVAVHQRLCGGERDAATAFAAGGAVVGRVRQRPAGLTQPDRPMAFRGNRGRLAGQVRAAQRVASGAVVRALVNAEPVMHHRDWTGRQHREVVDRGPTAASMEMVGSHRCGAGDVQPLLAAAHIQGGLVHADDRGQREQRSDQLLHLGKCLSAAGALCTGPAGHVLRKCRGVDTATAAIAGLALEPTSDPSSPWRTGHPRVATIGPANLAACISIRASCIAITAACSEPTTSDRLRDKSSTLATRTPKSSQPRSGRPAVPSHTGNTLVATNTSDLDMATPPSEQPTISHSIAPPAGRKEHQ